jgi:L-alanine-DL-glutamate epimerase-like enolase superfamily enzyme
MEGKFHTRAEWVKNRACDILRVGVFDVGGIGPGLKTMHLAESFGMHCEVHGGGVGNLSLCLAAHNCDWYERGLLHPFLDYDQPPAYLNSIPDMMDQDGYVHASTLPGLGEDINFDYIDNNLVG